MALDARKRQKKLERKRAKQRARKESMVRTDPGDIGQQVVQAARYPVLHCRVMNALWTGGMGQVLFSRQLPSRQVLHSNFLVDAYCLGVKDAYVAVLPNSVYQERLLDRMFRPEIAEEVTPAAACKLVLGAIEYARRLGFAPHRDFALAGLIFADVDPRDCDEQFEYGYNGKPMFIAGPYDTPERCRRILGILNERGGAAGSNTILHLGSSGGPMRLVEALPPDARLEFDDGFDE
jgi:hypothetical protein